MKNKKKQLHQFDKILGFSIGSIRGSVFNEPNSTQATPGGNENVRFFNEPNK